MQAGSDPKTRCARRPTETSRRAEITLKSATGSALSLWAEPNSADRSVLHKPNSPFRRTMDEVRHVDVVADIRDAAERQGAQWTEPGDDSLIERKLLMSLRRDFGGHPLVVRLSTAQGLDVLPQHLFAPRLWYRARPSSAFGRDFPHSDPERMIARLLSRQQDLETSSRAIGDDPWRIDVAEND